jgi:hypothetical protein
MTGTASTTVNPTGMVASYQVELLFDVEPPTLSVVAQRLRAALAHTLSPGEEGPEILARNDLLELVDRSVRDAAAPPRWLLTPGPDPPTTGARGQSPELDPAIQQSWWWPQAAAEVSACRASWSLRDLDLVTLDYRWRLRALQRILTATIEATACRAVHWPITQQLLDAADLAASMRDHDFRSPIPGAINVRFFQLAYDDDPSGDQEYLMDTLGLGALGLLDLQCHFRGLDPEDVARVLYDTASYAYESGAILRPGDTVEGPSAGDRWLCRYTSSLAEPKRELCALDPGFPFAADGSDAASP